MQKKILKIQESKKNRRDKILNSEERKNIEERKNTEDKNRKKNQ